MWLSADEALRRLQVKPQTLYASVSRGRIAAKPDPADSRRSLYSRDDVERMARKRTGRPRTATVAAEAIRWGDPVLDSAISTVAGGRLLYRGQDAVVLSRQGTLEEVAALLWQDAARLESSATARDDGAPLGSVLASLAARAAGDVPSFGRSRASLGMEAGSVFSTVAAALAGGGEGAVHTRLATHWHRPEAEDVLRRALVLLADHELNASTFAARIAASTGASLSAGTLAGLATLTGPLHGSAAVAMQSLARRSAEIGAESAIYERLAEGRAVPAFGHPLYPNGDVRAAALLDAFELPTAYKLLAEQAESITGERPNIDFVLAAMATKFALPLSAPIRIFALARSVGWLAHMLEQAETGVLIRPRARYTGPVAPVP